MKTRLLVVLLTFSGLSKAATTPQGVAEIGADLQQARSLYAHRQTARRLDCDPVTDGRWICASYFDPVIQDLITGQPGRYSGKPTAIIGVTLPAAKRAFTHQSILPRVDCDPVGIQWVCASFNNPVLDDVNAGTTPASLIVHYSAESGTGQSSPVNIPVQSNSPSSIETPDTLVDALYSPGDLLVLNYDSCPDADDLHAATAAKMVLDHYGLKYGVDYIVSNGTCGDLRPPSDYIVNSYVLFDKLYGKQWNDVYYDEANSISVVAEKLKLRLESGHKVWVLDGGPMDFTSRVIAYLNSVGTNADLKNITVVQHSRGWNEKNTNPANLVYMQAYARYLTIDNGNKGNNQTAQLNYNNNYSHTPDVDPALIRRFLHNDQYSDIWQVAFSLLNASARFDGSDTVELLWVMGLDSRKISDWHDFADMFLPEDNAGAPSRNQAAAEEAEPSTVDASSDTPNHSSSIKDDTESTITLELNSITLPNGWVRESLRAGYNGSGYIRWDGANSYGAAGSGVLNLTFLVKTSGIYELSVRARAINPERPDLSNDVWVRMNGEQAFGSSAFTDWVKLYTTGQDTWQLGGLVDLHGAHQPFRQHLQANTQYSVGLSGRSHNYAIDFIQISPIAALEL